MSPRLSAITSARRRPYSVLLRADQQICGPGSYWRHKIPANPTLDPNSATIVGALSTTAPYLNVWEYGFPTYVAARTDPAYTVTLNGTASWCGASGSQGPLSGYNPIRIPNDACRATGDDGWMYVYDPARNLVFALWQATKTGSTWTCSCAGVWDAAGSGWTTGGGRLSGYGTGAGAGPGGTITKAELDAGVIPHALTFHANCNKPNVFRTPANKTDGSCAGANPLEEGMRFQVRPLAEGGPNPATHSGLLPIERMVLKALQDYGAYLIDGGGSYSGTTNWTGFTMAGDDLADPARVPPHTPGDPTRAGGAFEVYGVGWDYFGLSNIPWSGNVRILKFWHGGASA